VITAHAFRYSQDDVGNAQGQSSGRRKKATRPAPAEAEANPYDDRCPGRSAADRKAAGRCDQAHQIGPNRVDGARRSPIDPGERARSAQTSPPAALIVSSLGRQRPDLGTSIQLRRLERAPRRRHLDLDPAGGCGWLRDLAFERPSFQVRAKQCFVSGRIADKRKGRALLESAPLKPSEPNDLPCSELFQDELGFYFGLGHRFDSERLCLDRLILVNADRDNRPKEIGNPNTEPWLRSSGDVDAEGCFSDSIPQLAGASAVEIVDSALHLPLRGPRCAFSGLTLTPNASEEILAGFLSRARFRTVVRAWPRVGPHLGRFDTVRQQQKGRGQRDSRGKWHGAAGYCASLSSPEHGRSVECSA